MAQRCKETQEVALKFSVFNKVSRFRCVTRVRTLRFRRKKLDQRKISSRATFAHEKTTTVWQKKNLAFASKTETLRSRNEANKQWRIDWTHRMTSFPFQSQLSPLHPLPPSPLSYYSEKKLYSAIFRARAEQDKRRAQTSHSLVVCIKLKHFFSWALKPRERSRARQKIVDQQQPAVGVVKKFTCIF